MPETKESPTIYIYNIKELLGSIFSKWYLLVSILILSTIVSLICSYFIVVPLYDSTGKIYIMNKEVQDINTGDISVSSYLAKDYENLIVDRAVLGEVSAKMNNKYSAGMLQSCVTVENPDKTRFIEITVRTPSPTDSKRIVDYICEISQEKIVEILGIDQVNIVRRGSTPKRPSVPNVEYNILKFDCISLAAYIMAVFVISSFNDKISTQNDVQKFLGLNVLGTIPYNSSKTKSKTL